jgi:hypothetical protein
VAGDNHAHMEMSFSQPEPLPAIPRGLSIFTLGSDYPKSQASNKAMIVLLSHLQDLAITWDARTSFQFEESSMSFSKGCKHLHTQVAVLSNPNLHEEDLIMEDYELESFRLACMIYSSTATEKQPIESEKRRKRLQDLQKFLRKTELSQYTNIPGALIWCFAVGITESTGMVEYSWFMAQLIPILMGLAMEKWEHLWTSLNVFRWLLRCRRKGSVLRRL